MLHTKNSIQLDDGEVEVTLENWCEVPSILKLSIASGEDHISSYLSKSEWSAFKRIGDIVFEVEDIVAEGEKT